MKVDIAYNVMGNWYITTIDPVGITNVERIITESGIYLVSISNEIINVTQKSYVKNRHNTDIGVGIWKLQWIKFVAKRKSLDELKTIAKILDEITATAKNLVEIKIIVR